MAMPLPLRFRGEADRVSVEAELGHEPLRDFFLHDLGCRPGGHLAGLLAADDPLLLPAVEWARR